VGLLDLGGKSSSDVEHVSNSHGLRKMLVLARDFGAVALVGGVVDNLEGLA